MCLFRVVICVSPCIYTLYYMYRMYTQYYMSQGYRGTVCAYAIY